MSRSARPSLQIKVQRLFDSGGLYLELGVTNINLRNGWSIQFQKNVHMYCHRLIATKGNRQYEVPCEDTPGGFLGVWLYGLELNETALRDLQAALVEWADSSGFAYRIYKTEDAYVTNYSLT